MGRFERENISKKVNTASHLFAVLAGIGILIIGLQLVSRTTGFDFFNINYSLANLFSDETSRSKNSVAKQSEFTNPFVQENLLNTTPSSELQEIAASYLQNNITVSPITPTSNLSNSESNENGVPKFSLINIRPHVKSLQIFSPTLESVNSKKNNQYGVLQNVKEVKYSKWSVGLGIAPGVSFTHLKYTNVSEIITRKVGNTHYGFYQTQSERNEMNKALMKYSVGLDVTYRLNKNISLQSGLVYFNSGESVLVKEITEETDPQNASGSSGKKNFFEGQPDFDAPSTDETESNVRFANNLSYFEIPMVLNVHVKSINELTDLEFQAGISITRLDFVTAVVYNFENDGYYLFSGSDQDIYQKYGSNAIAGVILNKYITNRIQVYVNPQFKIGLTNIFDPEYNIKQHYYNAGVRLGMKINL